MRITKLRGAADAAASRLEAVRAAVERQQRASTPPSPAARRPRSAGSIPSW
jgi:hypothetical protein